LLFFSLHLGQGAADDLGTQVAVESGPDFTRAEKIWARPEQFRVNVV
jgi:hypothetical protein